MAGSISLVLSPAALGAPEPKGDVLYAEHCASCHGANLGGSAHGVSLSDASFKKKWQLNNHSEPALVALVAYNQVSMPPGGNPALGQREHEAMARFLVRSNQNPKNALADPEAASPAVDLRGDNEALDSWSGVGAIADIAKNRSAFQNRVVENWQPVSQQELNEPDAADWLSWRRTLDGQGYSPLKQINRRNVGKLQLAWVMAMREGSNQVTPLVHQGIMFLTHPGNIVQAIDAATGELIWEYAYPFPPAAKTLGGPQRNIALYDNKVFLATYDAAIIALDARSGKLLWRTQKADYTQGYTHTSGPVVGDGVVLSGINGCERFTGTGCFITGHDPDTGTELWRTSTIALPETPEDATWGDVAPEFRAGGDTWIAGSYDAKLNLFYIGTAQAKPWVAASRGMSTDDAALYTNSTLALDPKTGKVVWYFQHIPGETIDMEVGFERVVVNAKGERWLFTVGKDGILWKLDPATGEFLGHTETLPQDVFADVNSSTGAVTYRPDIVAAKVGDPITTCPGIYGGHNWQSMAYAPAQRALIIPLHQLCSELVGREVPQVAGAGGFGGDSRSYAMPSANGNLGKLVAVDAKTLKTLWSYEQPAMFMTGALTTGGGLVFIGDLDRRVQALDQRNGKVLWQTRLGAPTHGYPITYAVGKEQYVAIPTGMGVFRAMTAVISPDIYQPANGQALYVFKLPRSSN